MRSVRRAIWTGVPPVSPAVFPNFLIVSDFFSFVIMLKGIVRNLDGTVKRGRVRNRDGVTIFLPKRNQFPVVFLGNRRYPGRMAHIMLVEDNLIYRELLRELCEMDGHTVTETSRAED